LDDINEFWGAVAGAVGVAAVLVFFMARDRAKQRRVLERAARLLAEQLRFTSERRRGAWHLRGVVESRTVDVRLSLGYFPKGDDDDGREFCPVLALATRLARAPAPRLVIYPKAS
jgi:hypothetical protein